MKLLNSIFLVPCSVFFFISCSIPKQIAKQADRILLKDSSVSNGYIGISIYEPSTGKYWYNYNADKYFVPASNTKLFTLYAGLKYLGDSLAGIKYEIKNDSTVEVYPTADPTFLHPDFPDQPVLNFLKTAKLVYINTNSAVTAYGNGWAWDDHQDIYMVPRTNFPMYGGLVKLNWISKDSISVDPKYFAGKITKPDVLPGGFVLAKEFGKNHFMLSDGNDKARSIPFESDLFTGIGLLTDTLKNENIFYKKDDQYNNKKIKTIYSRPVDSLFKPMMHNSDNFFAEQTLLMAGNERLGHMSDEDMIDTLLISDLKDIPQKPRWVDGSGLSRYNLFTPLSFVYILNKMQHEFGLERLKNILPAGNEGTLKGYYISDNPYIYAKTGTLGNISTISGFLITRKGKLLIFSVLANNYPGGATPVRRLVEDFLIRIRKKY